MKLFGSILILGFFVLMFSAAAPAQADKRKALSTGKQNDLLATRLNGGVTGTFDSFCSLPLFAFQDIAIHTEDKEINETVLHSPFPPFYKPTVRELFDTIGQQTGSSWKYDPLQDFWVFSKPAAPAPYTIVMADKWTSRDMRLWTGYKPPQYPAGMDVYYFGVFSTEKEKNGPALWEQVRNANALSFASRLKKEISTGEMTTVIIDGSEALYFEAPSPRPGILWRQWAFVKGGKAFVILSTLPADDKQVMSEVDSMVKSFKVVQ